MDRRNFIIVSTAAIVAPVMGRAHLSIPALKFHSVITVAPGIVWVMGGHDPSTGLHRQGCHKIDVTTGAILASDTVPYGFGHSPALLLDGSAVVPGGMGMQSGSFRSLQEIQALNLSTGAETVLTPVWPHGGYDLSAVELTSTKAIYCGGHAYAPSLNEGWARWDAGVIEMSGGAMTHTPLEGVTPRVYATAHRLDDHSAIFIGGWSYADTVHAVRNLNTSEVIHDQDGASTFPGKLIHARRYHSSRKIGDKIYVIGGTAQPQSGRPPAIGSIEEIDLTTGAVRELSSGLLTPRQHMISASVALNGKDYLLVLGGQSDSNTAVTDVELYDIAAETSQVIGTTRPCIDHDRISTIHGDILYTVGGADIAGTAYADIFGVQVPGGVLARD